MIRTRVGYAGGTTMNPTYHSIGDHSESFQVDYDPKVLSYSRLLEIFWSSHSPCGGSSGGQYRSAVFTMNDEQQRLALASKAGVELEKGRVTTAVEPLRELTWAEDYHQKYSLRCNQALAAELRRLYATERDFENSTAAARINAYLAGEGTAAQVERDLPRLGLSEESQRVLRARIR